MLLKTSNGNTYTVDWIDTISTGALYMQMPSTDPLSKIAAEFEGLEWLMRESENQGNKRFEGYNVLSMIRRDAPDVVVLSMKEGKREAD